MMTTDENPSSNDDAAEDDGAPADDGNQPSWSNHPAIITARAAVDTWLESGNHEPVRDDDSYAVHNELMNGSCSRELRRARDDLERARARYADAVKAARAVGFSWGEIGRVLGVPRQLLHRRFR
jgi:hypothetical protein